MAAAPGDRLLRVGMIVTVVGLILSSIALLPLLFPDLRLPGAWWFLSMITGVGLALVIFGLIRASRARRGDRVP
jgi:hypothetical protein